MGDGNIFLNFYIDSLNLPFEKKQQLLATNPKTLSDISLWLKEHDGMSADAKKTNNPFSPEISTKKTNEIQLFGNNNTPTPQIMNYQYNKLVDTDDASWGLAIEKTGGSEEIESAKYYPTSTSKTNYAKQTAKAASSSVSPEVKETQDTALETLKENLNNAGKIILQQSENEGVISKGYNSLKEYFDAELGKSSVCRNLYAQQSTIDLLERAQQGNLTKEEYFGAKFDTVISLITANMSISATDREYLVEALLEFTPDELNKLLDNLKEGTNEQFSKIEDYTKNLIEQGKKIKAKYSSPDGSCSIALPRAGSIRETLSSDGKGKELMSFEDVYAAEMHVTFSKENIEDYEQKMAHYMMAEMISGKINSLHATLDDKIKAVKNSFTYGTDQELTQKQLESALISALISAYGNNEGKINAALDKLSGGRIKYVKDPNAKFSQGKLVSSDAFPISGMDLANVAETLLSEFDDKAQQILGDKSLEDYKNEMGEAYKKAYGEKNATQLAKAFQEDQESITGQVRMYTELAGAGVMVAGMFIATPIAITGAAISSFGGIGVEALNESTRKNGMSEEEKKELAQEIVTNAALLFAGGAAGRAGSAAKAALIAEKCPKLAACLADIGVDATLSLIGDMVLTGELNIQGEGLSQILSLVAGHVRTRKFGKSQKPNGSENKLPQEDIQKPQEPKIQEPKVQEPKVQEPRAQDPSLPNENRINIEKLEQEIKEKLNMKCSDEDVEELAQIIASKPELADRLKQLVSTDIYSFNTLKELLKMATEENIDELSLLAKNSSLQIKTDPKTGQIVRNDFERVMSTIRENPQYKTELTKIAQNKFRTAEDIEGLVEKLKQYPDMEKEILDIAASNNNVKFGHDINGNKINHIDELVDLIRQNPDLKAEIIEFMKIQRQADNSTFPPVSYARGFVMEIKNHPELKDLIIELSKDPNLHPGTVAHLYYSKEFQPISEYIDVIKHLAKMGYDRIGIETQLKAIKKNPKLKDILLEEAPKYELIDNNPAQTPAATINKRFAVRDKVEKIAKSELKELQKTLGDDFYHKIKWEQIIPENASPEEIKKIVKDLNEKSKFFSREASNERDYGKNIQWAHQIYVIEKCAQEMLKNGTSYDEVMKYISESYKAIDVSKTLDSNNGVDERRQYSGMPRERADELNIDGMGDIGALRPFGTNKNSGYNEYYDRFMKLMGKERTYKGIQLTEIGYDAKYGNIMEHPPRSNVKVGMDYIRDLNKNLDPLFAKVRNGEKLTPAEKKMAEETIAEIYFVYANIMPYERGSNGIGDIMLRSMYESLGMELPALKKGVSLDLEAFSMDADEFKKNWRNFFVE